jgi:hypothetical protein
MTCCFFASLKTLLIPTKATALCRNQRPRASLPLAGFEVTLIGRFWVTPEDRVGLAPAHSHAAESDGGHFEIAFSEFARLHKISLRRRNDSLRSQYFQGDVVIPVCTYLDWTASCDQSWVFAFICYVSIHLEISATVVRSVQRNSSMKTCSEGDVHSCSDLRPEPHRYLRTTRYQPHSCFRQKPKKTAALAISSE